jgi:oxidase EvaA
MLATDGVVMSTADFRRWFAEQVERDSSQVSRITFDRLTNWYFEPATGSLVHDSGRFFSVRGLSVRTNSGTIRQWTQPIINQPEIGILGILVKEINGILHCLVQAKMEPGNRNGVQLSPTVQATRSNYTGVHRGKQVPYLQYFHRNPRQRVLADVLQSEQGSWFYRKHNRNIIVEVTQDVELIDGFCWLSIGQLHELLYVDDLVNMDTRTVLSCLPFCGPGMAAAYPDAQPFQVGLARSLDEADDAVHTIAEVLNWITEARVRAEVDTTLLNLRDVHGWQRSADRISHDTGRFFDVMAVAVRAGNREVGSWTQPMIESRNLGIVAFLVRRVDGVLHALVNARVEPGYLNVVELAPTVQCTPENYADLPEDRPPFLADVLDAPATAIRFDAVLSEEGGRFFLTRNRYLVVEVDHDFDVPEDFCWLAVRQLVGLMQHSHYVNIQARTLTACVYSMMLQPERV